MLKQILLHYYQHVLTSEIELHLLGFCDADSTYSKYCAAYHLYEYATRFSVPNIRRHWQCALFILYIAKS